MANNTVREVINQQKLHRFRTEQIATSSNYVSGRGGTFNFHASGFVNAADVKSFVFVGNGLGATNYDVSLFMTSSMTSAERQYYYTGINLRTIDNPDAPIPIFDIDNTGCIHGKLTNNDLTSGLWMNFIELRYHKLLEVS